MKSFVSRLQRCATERRAEGRILDTLIKFSADHVDRNAVFGHRDPPQSRFHRASCP